MRIKTIMCSSDKDFYELHSKRCAGDRAWLHGHDGDVRIAGKAGNKKYN